MDMLTLTPYRTDAMSWVPWTPALEKLFGRVDRFGEPYNLSVKRGEMLLIPRNCAKIGVEDYRARNPLDFAINCKCGPKNEDQARVIQESFNLLSKDQNHVIEAPTGWGKSYVGSAIAAKLGQTTLIAVPKTDLMNQWYSTLVNLIGISPSKIGKLQGSVCDYKGKSFVLGMTQSLMIEGKYPDDLYKYFGFVIYDEVHHQAAVCFQRLCQLFSSYYRLGLSATAKRGDGRNDVIEGHIGKVCVRGTIIPMCPKIIVQHTGIELPKWLKYTPGRMMGVYKYLSTVPPRNAMICNFVRQSYATPRTTLILSDLKDHLVLLFKLLAKAGVKGEDMGFYVGGMKSEELKLSASKKIVLGTYKMVSEGTDYPHWDTVVFATPSAKIKQSIGRVLRTKEGKSTPVAYDLVDKNAILGSFYKARETQYYSLKGTVVKK